ncbi:hypothetical protein [Streptomyces sp. MRC013]|uniref:hypothetical protein n=1 Tax=Streptomyces sp. MRC013 TaxID=2898276 RepID=UPI0024E1EBEF|nr:hypothetical protein [Streptomyces sp. MRC013]
MHDRLTAGVQGSVHRVVRGELLDPPKRRVLLLLTELRKRWRTSAIQAYDADVVDRLVQLARAATAAVRARVLP